MKDTLRMCGVCAGYVSILLTWFAVEEEEGRVKEEEEMIFT